MSAHSLCIVRVLIPFSLVQCKGNLLQDKEGIIQSPEYPNNYPPLADCAWNVVVEKGYSIVLEFDDVSLVS